MREDTGELFDNLGVGEIFRIKTENVEAMKEKTNLTI